ncbi:hypothetical protein AMATHDRAFT_3450 [Amanita thiersii Skay4041]|uniref:Thioesterase domain-containing protein n=1 Tax=Amanita thiersii Skay4041 TaxID=703135 RepID=A0A2A9NTB9_9AGAR|nr:hypothetical protein AMATHDRAFT_3450 [Amanita thiersii Skay4041]
MFGIRLALRATNGHSLRRGKHTIADLQAAFRDPTSPYHIPQGSQGPASPDELPQSTVSTTVSDVVDGLAEAQEKMMKDGFDPESFWEQRIVWGDQDAFQHVNNVRYVRFFESSRIRWMKSIAEELGGPEGASDMIKAKGVALILKSIAVQFRRPVTYPDTLLVGYRPVIPKDGTCIDPAAIYGLAKAYSLSQRAYVAYSNEVLVWYDYDKLKKCDPGDRTRAVVNGRIRTS